MIVFYTRYNVIESFNTQELMGFAFGCVSGMRNAPEEFKNISWDGTESGEWKADRSVLAYEIDNDAHIVAFRVAIVDENDELWTTDIALDDKEHEIQLRLAREKRIVSADYSHNFNVPFMFKKLIRDKIGGMDSDLPIIDKPIYVDDQNISIISALVNGKRPYVLPVIHVSHPFEGDDYALDVEELAKDMAGSAHVIVEKTADTAKTLRELTKGNNAFNGAIDVFYNDDSFRYLKWAEITSNQYRYRISHAVYARMAMRNIDDDSSLSSIRLKNKIRKLEISKDEAQLLKYEVEDLMDKRKSDNEILEHASEELKQHEKRINELENENHLLESKIDALSAALNQKNNIGSKMVALEYSEEQYYEDEIKRMILECIKNTLTTYGDKEQVRRDYHILKDIVSCNTASEIGNNIKKDLLNILKKNGLNKSDISSLKGLGFERQKSSHDKYVFHGDDRYILTVSNSPSDYTDGENLAHEAINLIFGRT